VAASLGSLFKSIRDQAAAHLASGKDEVAREYLAKFKAREGILFVGNAQEQAVVVRTISQKNPRTGRSYLWLQKST